ncbi:hypothetical protein N7468_005686 [Penicillium chermesinum]|uniref:MOSC domain-containing protein n=1 Tax=Penicillium chermesinum TaxID=63820 RepID=A0A9W9NZW2_9EURO|nr:uncharacterized protein N7468_005686 [Penicillium chermesinum]KAJ5232730.1 hypothetical protein N7468_005686 [Penicillium chermesinum]
MKVTQLYIYPIKSLRPTSLESGFLTAEGLRYDRRFILLKVEDEKDGSQLSFKNMQVGKMPEMSLFLTAVDLPESETDSGKITITYNPPSPQDASDDRPRESRQLEVPLLPFKVMKEKHFKKLTISMYSSSTTGYDMGPTYNKWFSECFGYPVVLAYLGENRQESSGPWPPRSATKSPGGGVPGKAHMSPGMAAAGAVVVLTSWVLLTYRLFVKPRRTRITFADCAPYLVISQASVDNVSARLPDGHQMDPTKFRPNIVVSGAEEAFEEDFWTELVIGPNKARLLLTGNCVRCPSLNVNYTTGKMSEEDSGMVLKRLMKDRRVDRGAKYSPVFGRYSFLKWTGEDKPIRVGDPIEIGAQGKERTTVDWPGLTN